MKVEILIDKLENREDAFWYRGVNIARIQFPNGKKLYVDTCGEIKIKFEEEGMYYKNAQATDMARDLNLTDEDLNKIGQDFDGWDMNNWFAIIEVDIDGNYIGDDLAIGHDYDHAIELLKEVHKEKMKEYYT